MALSHAILVSLSERAATGYDLGRRFDASIGHFWRASHQQIYKVLGQMEADGLVASEAVAQAGKPDKKVYVMTAAGHDELRRWAATPTSPEPLRSEFAVKLRALGERDRAAAIDDVERRRSEHLTRLEYYEKSAARFYPDPSVIDDEALGAWLVLRGGVIAEEAGIRWCDEILERLGSR